MEEALYVVRTLRMLANSGRVADYGKADCATGAESWPWYRQKKKTQKTRNDEMTNRTSEPTCRGNAAKDVERLTDRQAGGQTPINLRRQVGYYVAMSLLNVICLGRRNP